MSIYALSTGPGISGIAVVRVSGQETAKVIKLLTNGVLPTPRMAVVRKINKITDPKSMMLADNRKIEAIKTLKIKIAPNKS